MNTFPNSPKVAKGGIVLIDPQTSRVHRIVSLQYNPETLTRTLQVQESGADSADRSQALRMKGPAVEIIKLDAEIDATDQLEFPKENPGTVENGIQPELAALETLVYPASSQLYANNALADSGALEILPMEAALTLFVWSKSRVVPVRITDFSITEEAFDARLNPIRAKVSLGMRVLSVDDLGFQHKGSSLFMSYLQTKERLSASAAASGFGDLGIVGIP